MKHLLKVSKVCVIVCVIGLLLPSCSTIQNANKSQKGTVLGALGGAALGALIGGKDNRALGAVIGAAVGGGAGAIIGKKMDKQAEDIQTTLPGAEVKRTAEGIQIVLEEKSGDGVKFPVNSSLLTSQSKETLSKLVTVFNTYADTNILVVGHTDSSGEEEYNMDLSKRRASSVVNYLAIEGVFASRLKAEGRGETEPKFPNDTPENMAHNRRVEFAITANEKAVEEAKKEAGETPSSASDY